MTGRPVYKVYLAERSDGKCYVGCTKHSPEQRLREPYHPARWVRGGKPWAIEEIQTSVLLYTTSIAEAAAYETTMTAELGTLHPRGLNSRIESGYPGCVKARLSQRAA